MFNCLAWQRPQSERLQGVRVTLLPGGSAEGVVAGLAEGDMRVRPVGGAFWRPRTGGARPHRAPQGPGGDRRRLQLGPREELGFVALPPLLVDQVGPERLVRGHLDIRTFLYVQPRGMRICAELAGSQNEASHATAARRCRLILRQGNPANVPCIRLLRRRRLA